MAGKRLTSREKKLRAQEKKWLQEEGLIPPDKPRLNRKKFIEEARAEWEGRSQDCFMWDLYLWKALMVMLNYTDRNMRVTPEAVGAAKVMKMAVRMQELDVKLEAEGRKEYTVGEVYGYIKDILEA